MTVLSAFLFFLIGLFIGSFLNVLVDRLPREETIIKGRSYCEYCKKILRWYDLVPLLSFLQLKGKCRYCKHKLSFYYPLLELATGVLFALVVFLPVFQTLSYNLQTVVNILYYLFIFSALIAIFFTDLKYGIIPDKVVFSAVIAVVLYLLVSYNFDLNGLKLLLFSNTLSALGAFLFFYFLYFITNKKGMGFGDVKLSFLLGLILGFPDIIVSLYLSFLTGAFVALILVIWRKKHFFGTAVPFGPFLVIGTLITIFFQQPLLSIIRTVLPL